MAGSIHANTDRNLGTMHTRFSVNNMLLCAVFGVAAAWLCDAML